jgi:hypothetical protein
LGLGWVGAGLGWGWARSGLRPGSADRKAELSTRQAPTGPEVSASVVVLGRQCLASVLASVLGVTAASHVTCGGVSGEGAPFSVEDPGYPPRRPNPPRQSASRSWRAVRSAYVTGRLGLLVVDVTPVTHAAGGAVKLGNSVVDPGFMEGLSASVWRWSRDNGSWRADKVITIPAEPAEADALPPGPQAVRRRTAAGHRHQPLGRQQVPLRLLLGHWRAQAVRRERPGQRPRTPTATRRDNGWPGRRRPG